MITKENISQDVISFLAAKQFGGNPPIEVGTTFVIPNNLEQSLVQDVARTVISEEQYSAITDAAEKMSYKRDPEHEDLWVRENPYVSIATSERHLSLSQFTGYALARRFGNVAEEPGALEASGNGLAVLSYIDGLRGKTIECVKSKESYTTRTGRNITYNVWKVKA